MTKETNRIVTNILRILLVMEFLEVFHPKRKKSTRAAAADETEKPANILLKSAKKMKYMPFFSCLNRHFPVFWGEGVKTLARMVWGTSLLIDHQI